MIVENYSWMVKWKFYNFFQDLDMLKNYHPWGKPGGGAPNPVSIQEYTCL